MTYLLRLKSNVAYLLTVSEVMTKLIEVSDKAKELLLESANKTSYKKSLMSFQLLETE